MEVIDQTTLTRHWPAVVLRLQMGSVIVVKHRSQLVAVIHLPPAEAPSATVVPIETELAGEIQWLAGLYTSQWLSTALGMSDRALAQAAATGVMPDRYFDRLVYLRDLAAIVFKSGHRRAGRSWLERPLRELGRRTPSMSLRGGWKAESATCALLLNLARKAFPPGS